MKSSKDSARKLPKAFDGPLYTTTKNRIDKAKNLFFTSLIAARDHVAKYGSYHYQVFDAGEKHVGYAVPK